MRYSKLGSTGLDVSRICLGCMSYGQPDRGTHPWTLPPEESDAFLHAQKGYNKIPEAIAAIMGDNQDRVVVLSAATCLRLSGLAEPSM